MMLSSPLDASDSSNVGLVVEGGALAAMTLHDAHRDALVKLCSAARSVVFCRVSPVQKVRVRGRGGRRGGP